MMQELPKVLKRNVLKFIFGYFNLEVNFKVFIKQHSSRSFFLTYVFNEKGHPVKSRIGGQYLLGSPEEMREAIFLPNKVIYVVSEEDLDYVAKEI